jgi:cyanate permease
MDIARFLGILIVFGVPGIWFGGLVYDWFHNWVVVWIWEIILVIIAVNVALKATRNAAPESH